MMMAIPMMYRFSHDKVASFVRGRQSLSSSFYKGGEQDIKYYDQFFRFGKIDEATQFAGISGEMLKNFDKDGQVGVVEKFWKKVFQTGGEVIGIARLFSSAKLRDWFYYRARRGTGERNS